MNPLAKKILRVSLCVATGAMLGLFADDAIQARVYERGPKYYRAYGVARFDLIHSASMEINGETVLTEVFSTDEALESVAERFANSMKAETQHCWFHVDSETAFGFAQDGAKLSRFLFTAIGPQQTLLCVVHQEYSAKQAASNPLPSDFPEYPGAQAEMGVRNTDTNTRLASYHVSSNPSIIAEYYQQTLAERGWRALTVGVPPERAAEGVAELAFTKGNTMCVISCRADAEKGGVILTVLVRDLTVLKDTNL